MPTMELESAVSVKKRKASAKRARHYWEPVYDPSIAESEFSPFDWNTKNNLGPRFLVCSSVALASAVSAEKRAVFSNVRFDTCDFEGTFDRSKVIFKKCEFTSCDFGTAVWTNVKFDTCSFNRTSFSTSTFINCTFKDCAWKEIGISTLEMRFQNTVVTNTGAFIAAAYTNTDEAVLQQNNKNANYQRYRLEGTKAKVARHLLQNLEDSGDDDTYYDAVKTYSQQLLAAKAAQYRFHAWNRDMSQERNWKSWARQLYSIVKIPFVDLEIGIVGLSGRVNGWGGKLGRCAAIGLGLVLLFALIYHFSPDFDTWTSAAMASIEITLLVGFTKYSTTTLSQLSQLTYLTNMLLGLWWYTIFVPTLINRLSRTR